MAEAKRITLRYLIELFMLRVQQGVTKDQSLMSQELLPGCGNVLTMDIMISHLKQKEAKKEKKVD